MLIEAPLNINDTVVIKLGNGDELIAKLSAQTELVITVTKPFLMVLTQDPRTGAPGVQMAPFWMVGADKDVKYPINRQHVVCMTKANSDAAKSYTAQTTGLALPGGGLIT
jgi:hypothetical protein